MQHEARVGAAEKGFQVFYGQHFEPLHAHCDRLPFLLQAPQQQALQEAKEDRVTAAAAAAQQQDHGQ